MHSALFLGAMMALGAAAVPLDERAIKVVNVVDTVTVTVQPGQSVPTTTATPAPVAKPSGFLEGHQAPAPAPVPSKAPAPAPVATGSGPTTGGSAGGLTSDGVSVLDIINKWRAKYNLKPMQWNDALVNNAKQVGENGDGVNEIHELIPGVAMGQVITPGQQNPVPANQHGYSPFEVSYMAWLCEVSSDPQLSPEQNDGVDVCGLVQDVLHMNYDGTGHHDILCSPNYSGVACAFTENPNADQNTATYQGLWVCNVSQ